MYQPIDFGMFNYSYKDYLASDWWRVRASIAKEKANYRCEVQGCNVAWGLQVHHLDYSRLGKELDKDLICVCHRHHQELHNDKKKENYMVYATDKARI